MAVSAFDPRPQNEPLLDEIKVAFERVLHSGVFIGGPEVAALEREFAAAVGAEHAVAVSSGTDALLAALMSIGIGRDSAVLTTPFSFFATAGVIHRLGAEIVFADIDPETFNLSPERVRETLGKRLRTRNARRVGALLPVHLFGQTCDMAAFAEIAGDEGLFLVEDACQGYGARHCGRYAGTLGDVAAFSFYPTKNLGGLGDGGMLTTRDVDRATILRRLRNHGMEESYRHTMVGGNFRLDALQATALRLKLARVPEWNQERVRLAEEYARVFEARRMLELVSLPGTAAGNDHVFHQFVVRVRRRDELRAALTAEGIGCAVYYALPLHLQPCFAALGHAEGDFPAAERAAREVLALPMYPGLRPEQIGEVVDAIARFFEGCSPES